MFRHLMNRKEMIVSLYAHISTKDKGQNPENQLMRLREYCKAKERLDA